ncbi:MAG: SDR family oxidoreductase [Alphaproteobacteria bacterium]|nr:SDR family oxidoreductase [Alphaproteobacteria bacterium]MDX5369133.1 SDR family oxidoreductase [Alphaproteobacteria bacterium]MDX5463826.1 SDR family oxidoreductase [Alphaproteobacteria bacterium]
MGFSADLSGKIALVTGATSGLGERFARVLAKNGAAVAITGRRVERLEKLKTEIEAAGGKAFIHALDVTDVGSIRTCVDDVWEQFGPIDILINNSGIGEPTLATDFTPEHYDKVMDTNARGAFFVAQAVAKRMIDAGRPGKITTVASLAAIDVVKGLSVYAMSKAAAAHMTRALALEWARFGIDVNAICPGYIVTEINEGTWDTDLGKKMIAGFPRKRIGKPEDLDGLILLLSSPDNGFMTGSVIVVDDGQSLG